ncbi:hypothetical protein H5410_024741 [Solanum commersonii]|uniref:Uncharacterized protein n=1 Tax=Solanum commersonii TaxID=4109 RepID=A0A9J5ZMX4_SOLCO|nr:hypothetical protein H5410_024741 [Solanum commersonii]
MSWVNNTEKQRKESNCGMRSISPNHNVGQCIRGFKLFANIPWDTIDDDKSIIQTSYSSDTLFF